MAYRFSDTSKWADEWFVDLTPHEKLLFMYLCDNCDIAGFYEVSTRKVTFDIGLSPEDVVGAFKGLQRGYILSTDKKVIFLKNFIKHQKNLPLNGRNKSHKGILSRFENYKSKFLVDLVLLVNNGISPEQPPEGKPLERGTGNGIGNGIYTTDINNKGIDFEIFWNLYDKKVGDKPKVLKKWNKINPIIHAKIISSLPVWKKQFTDKQYQPYPETYLNQQRWNDEVVSNSFQSQEPIIIDHSNRS